MPQGRRIESAGINADTALAHRLYPPDVGHGSGRPGIRQDRGNAQAPQHIPLYTYSMMEEVHGFLADIDNAL
jgi:hypothetical protein